MTTTESQGLADDPTATIYQRMIAVMSDLPPIAKASENTQQNYMFRGLDDTLNALNPLLAKHGVMPIPRALELRTEQRVSGRGNAVYCSYVHMEYVWVGLAGDNIVTSFWGEGTDSLDKATNKAAQAAFKYCVFEAFAISTKESIDNDTDKDGGSETLPKWMTPYVKRYGDLPDDYKAKFTVHIGNLSSPKKPEGWQLNWSELSHKDWEVHIAKLLDAAEAKLAREAQDKAAEAPDSPSPEPENQDPEGAPATPPATEPQAEPPADTPPPTPEPERADDDDESGDDTGDGDDTYNNKAQYAAIVAWLDNAKGPALQTRAREDGVPLGGSVAELRQRLKDHWHAKLFDTTDEPEDEEDLGNGAPDTGPDDEYSSMDGTEITAQQVEILRGVVADIGDESHFNQWTEWRVQNDLPQDEAKWSQGWAMRALDFLESLGA